MKTILLILFLIAPIIGLVFIYRKRTDEEGNLILKMIGYYMLGAFTFSLNNWAIPIGFLVYLIAFHPVQNIKVKQLSAYLGLGVFALQLIISPIENYIFEWPREVEASGDNLYSFNFQRNWEKIQGEFDINNNAKLQNFEAEYSQEGEISQMNFEVVSQERSGKVYNRYSYSVEEQVFTVHRHRVGGGWHRNNMITASYFFSKLDELDLKEIKPQNSYSWYVLKGEGNRSSYAVYDGEKYIVNSEKITKVENYELPIKGYMITSCGKDEITEPVRLSCQERTQFFFDAKYKKKDEVPFTYQEAIAILRGNEKVNDWVDKHMASDSRRKENGKYYIKQKGTWEEVTEEKFRTKIEPFQRQHELRDQKWYITYEARFGDLPYKLEGVVDVNTGEILSVETME
ncbi:hypothetical protein [Alkalihalobacillus sp. AL-G]|uniref:hypothetical protein n=1 Tax=Alkalihalobacillus sp. AL-G TaxID=2926399 RepID=UPI00272B1497|nr:hypothetical protein [Alkalihalobacillus sp. AL-G]WLD92627.1 hypothetical protein MOJ78_16655 [Alkalihalobacillus sp. AL-G]